MNPGEAPGSAFDKLFIGPSPVSLHLYPCDYLCFHIGQVDVHSQTHDIELRKKINQKQNPFGKEMLKHSQENFQTDVYETEATEKTKATVAVSGVELLVKRMKDPSKQGLSDSSSMFHSALDDELSSVDNGGLLQDLSILNKVFIADATIQTKQEEILLIPPFHIEVQKKEQETAVEVDLAKAVNFKLGPESIIQFMYLGALSKLHLNGVDAKRKKAKAGAGKVDFSMKLRKLGLEVHTYSAHSCAELFSNLLACKSFTELTHLVAEMELT